jgi:hypothetical protein
MLFVEEEKVGPEETLLILCPLVLFREDLRILPRHAVAKLSGFATSVYLHRLIGVGRVHRFTFLQGYLAHKKPSATLGPL